MTIFTDKEFWKDAAERCLKTFAQVLLSYVGVTGVAFGDIDWPVAFSVAGVSVIASILTSIISYKIGDEGTASLIKKD